MLTLMGNLKLFMLHCPVSLVMYLQLERLVVLLQQKFPTKHIGDNPDYSKFNKADWEPRTHAVHIWYAQKQEAAKTETERKAVESIYGARYTSLYELPYYDAVSSCIIDPMHCLFLGIAKLFFRVWSSNGLMSVQDFSNNQEKVERHLTLGVFLTKQV